MSKRLILKSFEVRDVNHDSVFEQALKACKSPDQAFIVEVQNALNTLITKYSEKISVEDFIIKILPLALVTSRVSILMRLEIPDRDFLPNALRSMALEEILTTKRILTELNEGWPS